MYSHIHGVVIKAWKTFKEIYDENFINQLAKTFDHETYAPGDIVIEEGELTSNMYFITSGKVNIMHVESNTAFRMLRTGNYFGEIAFFTGKPRTASAK